MRLTITLLASITLALSACSSAKSFQVNRVSAYGFMRCANSTLKTQLRYNITQSSDTALVGTRRVGKETGSLAVYVRGMPKSPVIEVLPKNVPDSDRDALLKRCSEWTS